MTDQEKISTVQVLVENDPTATDAVVTVYLAKAESAILRRLYPYGIPSTVTDSIPEKYELLQCELASRGAECEYSQDVNGTNRRYGSENDEDLLSEVVPYAKVIG